MKNIVSPDKFWQWAYSDFRTNAIRGVLAEYIVAMALGCTEQKRIEWDAYDLTTNDGKRIEVKSSAYLQAWEQNNLSKIRFDIGMKHAWTAKTNSFSVDAKRSADVYVFCIFAGTEPENANELDLTQWQFLACSRSFLAENVGAQKSIGLSSLHSLGLKEFGYSKLREYVGEL